VFWDTVPCRACCREQLEATTDRRLGLRTHQQRADHPDADLDRRLIAAKRAAGEGQSKAAPGTYEHPILKAEAELAKSGDPEPQQVTPAGVAWVASLLEDPAQIDAEDVELLVEMYQRAPAADRRFLQKTLDRVRTYHDRQMECAELRAIINSDPCVQPVGEVEFLALTLMARRLREETPELTERGAENRALEAVKEVVLRETEARVRRVEEARYRLVALEAGGAVPKSTAKPEAASRSYEQGQRLARQQRERESRPLFDGMTVIGQ
jgi:hypothetical protein